MRQKNLEIRDAILQNGLKYWMVGAAYRSQ